MACHEEKKKKNFICEDKQNNNTALLYFTVAAADGIGLLRFQLRLSRGALLNKNLGAKPVSHHLSSCYVFVDGLVRANLYNAGPPANDLHTFMDIKNRNARFIIFRSCLTIAKQGSA
ncbi:hypothetical protein OUZ56_030295 [Daphnia magna]|uniref:Uncharacterized protein n=1 Tax=Daphnia magna TaxID=35525 RepID=A0ABQ9ZQW5_9CRUS|nr:hypothetical protein OUZ56_030295 [Daphnia magna]